MIATGRRLGQSPGLFAGPAVAAAVAFVWLPMVATLGLSFIDWSLLRQQATWRGLAHYTTTLVNPDFHLALGNTAIYLAALLPLQVGVPLALAFALVRVRAGLVGRIYRTALFAPSVLSFPIADLILDATEHKTLSIGLKLFATTGEQGGEWGPLMATALLAAAPVVALYLLAQRQIVSAFVTSGGR